MAYNGSGTFLINTAGQPVVSGTVISSTAFNALTADLATGLSTAITKDGQTTVTANIPMSTYKFTGLGVGSAATDSANLSQVQSTVTKLLNSVSGADTITATASPTLAAYAAGQMFYFVAAGDNTTSVTLNIDSLGAKAVTRDGATALAAADIKSGEVVVVVYDGTRFQVVSQLNSAGDARFANVSIASSLYVGGVSTFVGNAGFSANVSIASALSVGGVAAITGATTIGGNLTLSGGNLAFTSTAQRITADFSNATLANRLMFQTSTTNSNTNLGALPNGSGTQTQFSFFGSSDSANSSRLRVGTDNSSAFIVSDVTGTGTNIPLTFHTGGSERMRLDSSGNLGIGTASPSVKLEVTGNARILNSGADSQVQIFGPNGFASFVRWGEVAAADKGVFGYAAGSLTLQYRYGATSMSTGTLGFAMDSSGNLGIGTASPGYRLDASTSSTSVARFTGPANCLVDVTDGTGTLRMQMLSNEPFITSLGSFAMRFGTNNTERMRLDSSGNLGIGTASPAYRLDTRTTGTNDIAWFSTSSGGGGRIVFSDGNSGTAASVPRIGANANDLLFYTNTSGNSATERARITSGGDLLVGTTSAAFTGRVVTLQTTSASNVITAWNSATTGDNSFIGFFTDGGTGRGSITYNRGAGQVAYNITSDARLKENIADSADAGGKIDAMQVRQFDWKETGNHLDYGFVAQELHDVAPYAVSKPDDEDKMWSVDYSKLVPMLVKEVQSLRKRVAELESK